MPYENSFNQYNNLYNHEKFIGICSEYGVIVSQLSKCLKLMTFREGCLVRQN